MKKLLLVIAILASFVAGIITTVYFSTLFNLNNPESPEVTNESLNVSKESYSNEDLSGLTIFAEKGEEGFRTIETKILAEIAEIENVVIATGGGTPCFNNNMALMNSKGLTIYLETPTPDIAQRLITGKTKRPLLKDKTSEEIVEFIEEILPKRSTYYKKADLTINVVEN